MISHTLECTAIQQSAFSLCLLSVPRLIIGFSFSTAVSIVAGLCTCSEAIECELTSWRSDAQDLPERRREGQKESLKNHSVRIVNDNATLEYSYSSVSWPFISAFSESGGRVASPPAFPP